MHKILIQLDPDSQASVFDAVVALDAGVDHLLQYRQVAPEQVRDLVHGAIFTRGPRDLHQTAIFIGGSNVSAGEGLLRAVVGSFFGPMRVSVLLDSSGANTTAAAAVLATARHQPLDQASVLVLAGTGPVGQRAARLLARHGARVRVASRSGPRAEAVCQRLAEQVSGARLEACQTADRDSIARALDGMSAVIAAGAAGVELLPGPLLEGSDGVKVAVDLNAVPPAGIGGIEAADRAVTRNGVIGYGAIGIGGVKMRIHRAALARLFQRNDQVLDAEEIYEIGCTVPEAL